MTTVSIVIPAYNAQKYIRESVESALAQTHEAFEVVVVDDGSKDDTCDILKEYGESIRVIRQDNSGTAAACNAGVSEAKGEWVAFLDADDQWFPKKLELQLNACSKFAISHSDSFCFGQELKQEIRRSALQEMYSGRVLEKILVANFITKSTVIVSKEVYKAAGGFSRKYDAVEDWPLWISICAKHELGYVADPLVRYRVHADSKSMKARATDDAHMRIIEDAFSVGGAGCDYSFLKSRAVAESSAINAHYAATSGDWIWGVRCASRAIVNGRFTASIWKVLAKSLMIPFGYKY